MAIASEHRTRARLDGMEGLSSRELLDLLLGAGAGGELLDRTGGIRGLATSSLRELEGATGVGEARAMRVLAAMELGRRALSATRDSSEPVRSSRDIHCRLAPRMAGLATETFVALGLDVRARIISLERVAMGGLDECPVRPRDVFRPLLKEGASSCILAHNHPSGEPIPSTQDRLLTLRMAEAGRILGLRVLDHVIVATGGWYSFRDAGVI
jgi:DNA repair protein RadC